MPPASARGRGGLDPGGFRRALDRPETAAAGGDRRRAVAAGVFGVPSFVLGGQVYFGNDRLVLLRHAFLKEPLT